MAYLDLTQRQVQLLQKALAGTLLRDDGTAGPDWLGHPELAAVHAALGRLPFDTRACAMCGTTFEAKNPRRTTCSARCRQALSRSKRGGRAPAPRAIQATPAP